MSSLGIRVIFISSLTDVVIDMTVLWLVQFVVIASIITFAVVVDTAIDNDIN